MDRHARSNAWTSLARFLIMGPGIGLAVLLAAGALLTVAFKPSPAESAAGTWALLAAGRWPRSSGTSDSAECEP